MSRKEDKWGYGWEDAARDINGNASEPTGKKRSKLVLPFPRKTSVYERTKIVDVGGYDVVVTDAYFHQAFSSHGSTIEERDVPVNSRSLAGKRPKA